MVDIKNDLSITKILNKPDFFKVLYKSNDKEYIKEVPVEIINEFKKAQEKLYNYIKNV